MGVSTENYLLVEILHCSMYRRLGLEGRLGREGWHGLWWGGGEAVVCLPTYFLPYTGALPGRLGMPACLGWSCAVHWSGRETHGPGDACASLPTVGRAGGHLLVLLPAPTLSAPPSPALALHTLHCHTHTPPHALTLSHPRAPAHTHLFTPPNHTPLTHSTPPHAHLTSPPLLLLPHLLVCACVCDIVVFGHTVFAMYTCHFYTAYLAADCYRCLMVFYLHYPFPTLSSLPVLYYL